MDPSSTGTITEFAIVVAGFTGLVLAIGARDGSPNPLVKFRTVTMMFYAFTAAFGSLLPTLGYSLGFQPWSFGAFWLVLLLISNMAATVIASKVLLTTDERGELAAWMWALVIGGNSTFSIFLVSSLLFAYPISVTGAFFVSLVWQLILSTILFTRIILRA